MTWLDRINDRETRRLARSLKGRAYEAGELARTHFSQFSHDAGDIGVHAARDVAHYGRTQAAPAMRAAAEQSASRAADLAERLAEYGRREGAPALRETAEEYAARAGEIAQRVADFGRREGSILAGEGAVLAREAAHQALRAGRAAKADPVPVIVGVVGAALLANLMFGRRRG
jgi:hypothetical protein